MIKSTYKEDTSDWRDKEKSFSVDVIGGMTPDIVICDGDVKKTRIIIEVKYTRGLGYDLEDSQIIRYFLYLLCSTNRNDSKIPRAVFLAAPNCWFKKENNKRAYDYFIDTYRGNVKAVSTFILGYFLSFQNQPASVSHGEFINSTIFSWVCCL